MVIKTAVIVSDFAHVEGGATAVAVATALALADSNIFVYFFAAVPPIDSRLRHENIKVLCLNQEDILSNANRLNAITTGITNRYAGKQFKKLLVQLDPISTVIHVHTWTKAISSSVFSVAKKLHFKVFLTIHDYFLVCPNGGLYNYKSQCVCKKAPLTFSCLLCNCDSRHYYHKIWRVIRQIVQNIRIFHTSNIQYIFISDTSKTLLNDRACFGKNQHFLQNPIDFGKRVLVSVQDNFKFVFIGRVAPEKGIRLFCKAAVESNVDAVVVGDGPLKQELEKEYGDRILFTGWLNHDQIRNLLLTARALVFPSLWYEVSPLTPIEVQAMGIPSIISDTCAAAENIKNMYNGVLFETGNLDSLKEKMQMLMDCDVIQKLGRNTFDSFGEEKYSQRAYCKNLLKIYEIS